MSAPVDVLADLRGVLRIAKAASVGVTGNGPRIEQAEAAIAAVAELVSKSERVAATLEMPALARQSTKNANAGFIDWRALKGEVAGLRATLAKFEVTP